MDQTDAQWIGEPNVVLEPLLKPVVKRAVSLAWQSVIGCLGTRAMMKRLFQRQRAQGALVVGTSKITPSASRTSSGPGRIQIGRHGAVMCFKNEMSSFGFIHVPYDFNRRFGFANYNLFYYHKKCMPILFGSSRYCSSFRGAT